MVDGESVWWVHLCKTTCVHIRGDVVLMVSPRGGYTSVRQHVYTLEGMLWLMVSLCGGYTSVRQHVHTLEGMLC